MKREKDVDSNKNDEKHKNYDDFKHAPEGK